MRPSVAVALSVALAASSTACLYRKHPRDPSIETTVPKLSATTSLPRTLRIATFNVHREPGDVVLPGIRDDEALRTADLIVMQEVHRVEAADAAACSAACSLGKDLGFHARYAPGHVQGDGTDGVAVLSRAPILSSEVLELPFFDVTFNSGRRVALAVRVLSGGKPITVYAVHLDNRLTVDQRRAQLLPVLEHARRQTTPVLIAGDVNTSPFTWIGGVLPIPTGTQGRRLEALVREHGFDTPVVASGPTFRFLSMRLDAIYTRGFRTRKFAVAPGRFVSDHFALWALVEPT